MKCAIVGSVLLTLLLLTLAVPGTASAAQSPTASRDRHALIDIPYLPQTEQLCGGAALAMVLRYWGATTTSPQDFAPLVDNSEGGIRTSVLTGAAVARGWSATALNVDASKASALMQTSIDQGRPLIALIEERPGVYHYVVLVGVTDDQVVLHDPARAPYRVMARADFDKRWAAAGRWLLLVLPGTASPTARSADAATTRIASSLTDSSRRTGPCAALVEQSVSLAIAGNRNDAESGLLGATSLCPRDADGWRELAGLRFVDKRYADAAALATRATQLAPDDQNAWEVLASSRFLRGDAAGALEAWNHLGQPRIDTVIVEGAERAPQPIVIGMTGLRPQQLLTRDTFLRAGRRLAELPSAGSASLRLRPTTGGVTNVVASVAERPLVPKGAIPWATIAINTLFVREIRLDVAGLFEQGDLLTGAYRFQKHRPRVRGAFSLPSPGALPGVICIEASWERQAYAPAEVALPLVEAERRRVVMRLSDWATSWLRWQVGGGLDRFDDRDYGVLDAAVNTRWFNDRVAGIVRVARWQPRSTSSAFSRRDASVAFRSTRASMSPALTGQVRVLSVSDTAPLLSWPIASSSDSREVLLRAHPLYDDGVITGDEIGRRVSYATVEYQHPVYLNPYGGVSVAGFTDVAHATRRQDGAGSSPTQVDIGAGLRVSAPTLAGQMRIDVAYGLRTRDVQFSAGYVLPWGQ